MSMTNAPLWFSNLVFWSAQVAILVLAAALLPRLLRLRQPRVLLFYWRIILSIALLLPLLQPWHRAKPTAAIVASINFEAAPVPAPSGPVVSHWQLPSLPSIAPILGALILAGVAIRLMMLALGLLKLRRLRRASCPVTQLAESAARLEETRARVKAQAEFRVSAQVDSPVTFGFTAPVILLPKRFASLDPSFQSAIACHELLHVRRRDWAHHLIEEFLRCLFWFHPAIAWLISCIRLACEQVVDLAVIQLTQERKTYLDALLEFTSARAAVAAVPAPPFLAECQLVERIALMVKEVRMSRTKLVASLAVISCCLALVIAAGAWTFPLKAAVRAPQASPSAGGASLLQRIEVKHHDFDRATLNDAALRAEELRMNQLPGRLTVENSYDQAKADNMKKLLEDFWNARGVTVEVRSTLTVDSRSPLYAALEFDVYQQTLLPGRLEGGINGGVSGGVTGGLVGGVAEGPAGVASGVVSGGPSAGISGGVAGGISGERRTQASSGIPTVSYTAIWTDTVKRGQMVRQVRGLGKLVSAGDSTLVAKITVPVILTVDVRPNQSAAVDTRMGVVKGHVVSINPSGDDGSIEIALDAPLPERATVGLSIDATIDIETLENVLYVGRPVRGAANTTIGLFKISKDGSEAQRVSVKLGRTSVNTIEILGGLQGGDKIILSDTSDYDNVDRIRLTDNAQLQKR